MRWNVLEQSTRLLLVCLRETLLPRSLQSFKDVSDLVTARGRYYLHLESISSGSFVVEQDWPWRMGRLAWDMRNKKCADDRDKVYGILNLIGTTDLWKMLCMDSSFTQITTNRLNGLTTSFGGDSEDTHLSSTLGYRVAKIPPKGR
jgi:hypothetical protein